MLVLDLVDLTPKSFYRHMDIVHALVAAGANIHLANHSGGTCLMNSVKSAQLASFLITQVRGYLFLGEDMISVIFHPLQGADVNAEDVNQRTALHLAIQEHRLDTVRLLVEAVNEALFRPHQPPLWEKPLVFLGGGRGINKSLHLQNKIVRWRL